MRFLHLLQAALALAVTLAAPFASAQVEANPKPVWVNRAAGAQTDLSLINRADCLDEDALLTFTVAVSGATDSQTFEVWAGSGCNDVAQRDSENSCMKVAEAEPEANTEVELSVKDLVQTIEVNAGIGTGTIEDCTATTDSLTPRTLYFLLVNSGNRTAAGQGQFAYKFDMSPPDPPSGVEAAPGDESFELEFNAPDDDVSKYRFYCSELGAETEEPVAGAAGATGVDPECASSVLVAGQDLPASGYTSCGESNATGSASGTAEGKLKNGVTYAVAVTSVDEVGNISVLSNVVCGTPIEVTGYFEAYRAAGGQAGGGFCSFAPARAAAVPIGFALLLAGAAFARRRR